MSGLCEGRALSVRPISALGDGADVRGLQALRPLLHLEFDLLPFGQRAEAVRLDGGVMAEDVRAAVVLHDEPEPLRVIEPLHGTSNHCNTLSMFGRHLAAPSASRAEHEM